MHWRYVTMEDAARKASETGCQVHTFWRKPLSYAFQTLSSIPDNVQRLSKSPLQFQLRSCLCLLGIATVESDVATNVL